MTLPATSTAETGGARHPRPPALASVAVLAVIAASGVLYATLPPSPDQWFLGYTGWRLAEGAVPYQGFADGNWPACHWLHALSVLLLGTTPHTWRVFDFALMLTGVGFAASIASSVWGRRAALWLLGLYPALYVANGYWYAGERDFVGAHLLLVALWFYWRGLTRRSAAWQVGTGLLLALSALVKPTFAVFGPLLAVHAVAAVRAEGFRPGVRLLHVAVAGAASVGGMLAGFAALALQGTSLAAFRDLAVESIVVRYGNDSRSTTALAGGLLATIATSWHWIFAGAALGFGAHLRRRAPDPLGGNLLFPVLWVTGLASYALQVQGLGYTLDVLFAATVPILCSGLGLVSFAGRPLRSWRTAALATIVLIPVAGTAKKWSGELGSSFAWLSGRIDRTTHYSRFGAGDDLSASEAMALAAELERRVPPGGTVLVWGRANAINFLSRRPQPTRFHHNVVITRSYLPERLSRTWNAWFQEEVEARAPEACLVNERELGEGPAVPASVAFLRRYLEAHYVRERTAGASGLYLRK